MSAINITGLKVEARHGVLPEEKRATQPFVFDIAIDYDILPAAHSDEVENAVDYAQVCALVQDFCKQNCFDLIERLAYGAARLIVQKFERVTAAEVTVHKPQAPIPAEFQDVSVTARVERNKVILSLGSSMGDREAALNGALKSLNAADGLKILKVSDFIETEPYGCVAKNSFLNCAAVAECLLSPRELLEIIHKTEAAFGRVRDKRWDDRTLDIDLIFFGGKIIAEEGLCVPHPDYFRRDFVIKPLKCVAPDFVCPLLHKRIADL